VRDKIRREDARLRAEAYAPAPKDSRFLYVVIAIVLLFLAMAAIGGFYAIDVWREPLVVVGLAAMAAAAGLAFRFRKTRLHKAAHRNEYEQGDPSGDR
jgi:hypothetical protein